MQFYWTSFPGNSKAPNTRCALSVMAFYWLTLRIRTFYHEYRIRIVPSHHLGASTLRCRYNVVNFPRKFTKTPHSSPVRAIYGVCFVCSNSDLYFDSVTAVMCATYCNNGLHYNDTRLYVPSVIYLTKIFVSFLVTDYPSIHRYALCRMLVRSIRNIHDMYK